MRDGLGQPLARYPFWVIKGRSSAQNEIERVGVFARPRRFGCDQFAIERDCNLAGYLILQREQVVSVMVEPLGPYMHVRFRVDQLSVDPDLPSDAPNTAFQDVAHIQLAADP